MSEVFVIWSFEHEGWRRPGRWGYTPKLEEARLYSQAAAAEIVMVANLITVNEMAVPVEAAATFTPPASFCCPRCRRRSFNLNDVRERYCGACHALVDDPPLPHHSRD